MARAFFLHDGLQFFEGIHHTDKTYPCVNQVNLAIVTALTVARENLYRFDGRLVLKAVVPQHKLHDFFTEPLEEFGLFVFVQIVGKETVVARFSIEAHLHNAIGAQLQCVLKANRTIHRREYSEVLAPDQDVFYDLSIRSAYAERVSRHCGPWWSQTKSVG